MTDDRGLSEALGFVLVFSIVVTSVGMAYAMGYGGLQDVRDVERVNNAERAFDVLADNMEDVTQRDAPSRATEIKLADARLSPGDPVTINVSVPDRNFGYEADVDPVVYSNGEGTTLRYVGGAVVRAQRDGAVMVREPDLLLSAERAVVPITQTREQSGGISGSTTVLVRASHSKTVTQKYVTDGSDAYVNVTTPETRPWQRYLVDQPAVKSCDIDGQTVACEIDTEQVYVSVPKIDYTITG